MSNVDPASEVRAMYKATLQALSIPVYDAVAPTGAGLTQPYAVIRSVDAIVVPIRGGIPEYRAIVNIDIQVEFKEYGGSLPVDSISTSILDVLVPSNQKLLPPITGWLHCLSRFIRTTTSTDYLASTQIFVKRLVVEHLLKLNP